MTATKRVTLFDYGAGNLHSLAKAVAVPNAEVRIEADPAAAIDTDFLVLPGVGAFTPAAERLAPARDAMRERILAGLPTLGICLGMQLLFDVSDEGPGQGLGVIPGRVRRIDAKRLPQIGWNTVERVGDTASAPRAPGDVPEIAYFANGYVCAPDDPTTVRAVTTHESDTFASMVAIANAIGVQFHPEKSSTAGVAFVRRTVLEGLR